jgi:hypothetical protein
MDAATINIAPPPKDVFQTFIRAGVGLVEGVGAEV